MWKTRTWRNKNSFGSKGFILQKSTNVYIEFYLLAINDLSETTETLKTTGFLSVNWNDAFLQWTPSDHGGIDLYHWPQNEVWKPDIALKNSYLDYKSLGVDELNVENYYDGSMNWFPFQVFQTTCSIDITYFPFDKQTCNLEFQAWSYTKSQVNMLSGAKGIELWNFQKNSAWNVIDTSWSTNVETYEATISFTLIVERKPMYFILSVILPISMLAILNICVFLLPCESGEKASYAMTVFLAFAVFMTIVSSTLPQNSDSVAIISVFLIIQTVTSTLITIVALGMLRLNSFGEEVKIPGWFAAVMRVFKCRTCRQKRDQVAPIEDANEEMKTDFDKKVTHRSDQKSVEPEFTWKEVVNFLDVVFFVVFTLVLLLSSVITFTLASSG
ncbi:ACHA6-like protein [Mya arenaria]|uniref:ACHA6-like protein n=1 Tax=Mya arenaria TaxID=6604 RepID=A0ABY7GDC6_MYAAR|nr:ACHA6-like protein [Mya arenaria]